MSSSVDFVYLCILLLHLKELTQLNLPNRAKKGQHAPNGSMGNTEAETDWSLLEVLQTNRGEQVVIYDVQ